jgi:hypothetical protein
VAKAAVEQGVADAVFASLRAHGYEIDDVRRPDELQRTARAPDFDFPFGWATGSPRGNRVHTRHPRAPSPAATSALIHAMHERFDDIVASRQSGFVAVFLNDIDERVPRRRLVAELEPFMSDIEAAIALGPLKSVVAPGQHSREC